MCLEMINPITLAQFIETKLNDNDFNVVFRTYTYQKDLDRRYEKIDGVKTNFIPSIITSPMGSYLPMNFMRGERLSFQVEVLIPLSYKETWISLVDEFVWKVNGVSFFIDSSSPEKWVTKEISYHATTGARTDSYKDVFTNATVTPSGTLKAVKLTCQVPSFGSVSPQNFEVAQQVASYLPILKTESYIQVVIPISIKTVEGFFVGDNAKAYLIKYEDATLSGSIPIPNTGETWYQLKTTDLSIKNAKVPTSEHYNLESTGETFIAQNDVKFITTCYYENNTLMNKILENITTGENQNQKYWIKIELPTKTFYQKVVLFDNSSVFPIDDFTIIPLVFAKAHKVLG